MHLLHDLLCVIYIASRENWKSKVFAIYIINCISKFTFSTNKRGDSDMSYGGRLTKDIQTNIYTFPSMLKQSQAGVVSGRGGNENWLIRLRHVMHIWTATLELVEPGIAALIEVHTFLIVVISETINIGIILRLPTMGATRPN